MDRTKEFSMILQATEIPQIHTEAKPFFKEVHSKYAELVDAVEKASRTTAYEGYKLQPLLSRAQKLLEEYKQMHTGTSSSADHEEVLDNLRGMIRTNSLRISLRLNELKRSFAKHNEAVAKKAAVDQIELAVPIASQSNSQFMVLEEQQQSRQREEFLEERRRIVKSISEIGQVVEDISIHVSLQEEQLKRIDEIVTKSETWGKKALREIKETWEMTNYNSNTMVKFFAFWIIVFLLFWFIKR